MVIEMLHERVGLQVFGNFQAFRQNIANHISVHAQICRLALSQRQRDGPAENHISRRIEKVAAWGAFDK